MYRAIQEKIRSMLSNSSLPNEFWAEALATTIHLINRSPNKKLESKVAVKRYGLGSHLHTSILEYLAAKHFATF